MYRSGYTPVFLMPLEHACVPESIGFPAPVYMTVVGRALQAVNHVY